MKFTIPIDARLLVNNVEYKGIGTGLFTQLRLASDETTVKSTGTEIETSGVYEFEITGTALIEYLELWICTTENGTYTKVKSWGGTDGIRQITEAEVDMFVSKSAESQSITATGGGFGLTGEGTLSITSNAGNIEMYAGFGAIVTNSPLEFILPMGGASDNIKIGNATTDVGGILPATTDLYLIITLGSQAYKIPLYEV